MATVSAAGPKRTKKGITNVERIVEFSPAYDRRNADPHKDFGIAAVAIRFVLKGTLGAVQFLIGTGWYPKALQEQIAQRDAERNWFDTKPLAWDLGYHSRKPLHDDQLVITHGCTYLDGAPCYYDGSALQAEPIRDRLLEEGDKGVWAALEEYYVRIFGELK